MGFNFTDINKRGIMKSGFADNKGAKIFYETLGDSSNESIIFISGLGSQLVYWTDELCKIFIDRGFHIIRFDNRETGLSHKTPGAPPSVEEIIQNPGFQPLYTLSEMANDVVAVLDANGVEQAHVVGVSLGGMIAQTVAIDHPGRTKTLTSIMSAPMSGSAIREADDEAVSASLTMDMSDPNTYVDIQVEGYRVSSGPHFDPVYQREILQKTFDRCYHPDGWSYQMMASIASGDRTEKLGELTMPALVIHGGLDPLILPAGGEMTAAAIPNAKLIVYDDMGHNLPRPRWGDIAEAVAALAGR
ncbi:MAG: pimeloyl-ACP methyl ester carboxylesterase [Cellvibrionaceae bacterium]